MTGLVNRHDLTYSPVGLWQFDGNLNDSSGNGFTLTAESGTARYAELVPGFSCLYSNALRLVYNTSGTALAITGDMTVEFLFRGDTPTNSYFVGYAGGSGSGTQANNILYSMFIPSGLFGLTWTQENGSGSATSYAMTNRVLPRTTLCHVAVTRTANVIQFYLNGRVFGSASSALTTPDGGTTSVFRVGGDAAQNSVVGNIASLKVIASALSSAQIQAEFNRTLGPYYQYVTGALVDRSASDTVVVPDFPLKINTTYDVICDTDTMAVSDTIQLDGWDPNTISGLKAWIDMQDAAAYTTSSGKVSGVTNKKSSTSWTEATNRPTFTASGINGYPVMAGDAAVSSARILTTEAAVIAAFEGNHANTVAFVARHNVVSDFSTVIGVGTTTDANNSGNFGVGTQDGVTPRWRVARRATLSTVYETDAKAADLSAHVFFFTYDGTVPTCTIDGTDYTLNLTNGNPNSVAMTGIIRLALLCLPRSTPVGFLDGQLGELLVWDKVLNSTEKAKTIGFLKNKWSF